MKTIFQSLAVCFICAACASEHPITMQGEWQQKIRGGNAMSYVQPNIVVSAMWSDQKPDHYLINPKTGKIDTVLHNFTPVGIKAIHLRSVCKEKHINFPIFHIDKCRSIVARNYKGYDIAIEEYFRDIFRSSTTNNYRILVLKKRRVKQLDYIDYAYDFVVVDSNLYILGSGDYVRKYSFDSIVHKLPSLSSRFTATRWHER